MNFLKQLIFKGTSGALNPSEEKILVITNFILLLATLVASLRMGYFAYNAQVHELTISSTATILFMLAYFLNINGYSHLAKFFLMLIGNVAVLLHEINSGGKGSHLYLIIASYSVAFLLFYSSRRLYLLFALLIPTLSFFLAFYFSYFHPLSSQELSPLQVTTDRLVGSFSALVITVLITWFFVSRSNVVESNLHSAVKLKSDDNAELTKKMIATSRLRELGLIASGVAHEINNPLAVIIAKIDRIERKLPDLLAKDKEELREFITSENDTIRNMASRISEIVAGLKNYSRGGAKDVKVLADLPTIVKGCLAICKDRFIIHEVPLEVSEIPALSLRCRPNQIAQVLVNLLNNAFDAVEKLDEKWVRLEISCPTPEELRFWVMDSRRGIPEAILTKIKTPFYTTKDFGKGTGLGLSISNDIAEEHGGSLNYIFHEGHTSFQFQILIDSEKSSSQYEI